MRPLFCLTCFMGMVLLAQHMPNNAQEATEEAAPFAAMPLVDEGAYDIINILLMGSATENAAVNPGLTDSIMIVSLNKDTGHVAAVSIPRDLYVYIPGFGMHKLNQAYFLAELRDENRSGIAVLRETLTYNLGIVIDYYARVDFNNFVSLMDSVGGIDIAVDCAIEDWRLIEPDMEVHIPENWELVTLWNGLHHMDGDTALWYVRSRRTSSDFDRNRRQQDVLRALWRAIRAQGLLANFPALWEQFNQLIETDMTLHDALSLLPLALELDGAGVQYYSFRLQHEVSNSHTAGEGRFILEPERDAVFELMQQVVQPPANNRLNSNLPTVAIYNGSGIAGLDYVAAHRLEREGFLTVVTGEATRPRDFNRIVDLSGESKGSAIPVLQRVLRVTDAGLVLEPSAQRLYDYEVYIGANYRFFSCTYPVQPPSSAEPFAG